MEMLENEYECGRMDWECGRISVSVGEWNGSVGAVGVWENGIGQYVGWRSYLESIAARILPDEQLTELSSNGRQSLVAQQLTHTMGHLKIKIFCFITSSKILKRRI